MRYCIDLNSNLPKIPPAPSTTEALQTTASVAAPGQPTTAPFAATVEQTTAPVVLEPTTAPGSAHQTTGQGLDNTSSSQANGTNILSSGKKSIHRWNLCC